MEESKEQRRQRLRLESRRRSYHNNKAKNAEKRKLRKETDPEWAERRRVQSNARNEVYRRKHGAVVNERVNNWKIEHHDRVLKQHREYNQREAVKIYMAQAEVRGYEWKLESKEADDMLHALATTVACNQRVSEE